MAGNRKKQGFGGGAAAGPEDDTQLAAWRAALAERETNREAIEADAVRRGKTNAAWVIQVVHCRWERIHWPADRTIPIISVPPALCPRKLSTTEQDCRTCLFSYVTTYGAQLEPQNNRYHGHGTIIPIPDEETADELSQWMAAHPKGLRQLRNVDHEIAWLREQIALREAWHAKQQQEEIERAQGKRAGQQTRTMAPEEMR